MFFQFSFSLLIIPFPDTGKLNFFPSILNFKVEVKNIPKEQKSASDWTGVISFILVVLQCIA